MPNLLDKYLSEHPLTEREVRRGKAVRLVRYLRFGVNSAKWVFACFSREKLQAFATANGRLRRRNFTASHLGVSSVTSYSLDMPNNGAWFICEYAVDAPPFIRSLHFAWQGIRYNASYDELTRLSDEYYDEICNAGADKDYTNWLEAHRSARALSLDNISIHPLISIVVPLYHTPPQFLREMIDSVMAQTYTNFELILVNGSPDDAQMHNVLSSYSDKRMRVIKQTGEQSIVSNTNKGIEESAGVYVAFLDHDDTLEPDALLYYVKAIEESQEKDGTTLDLIYCDEDNIGTDGAYTNPMFKPGPSPTVLFSHNYIQHLRVMRKACLDEIEPSGETMNSAGDNDLVSKVFESGYHVKSIPEVLYHWRMHESSLTHNGAAVPADTLKPVKYAIEDHIKRLRLNAHVKPGSTGYNFDAVFDPWGENGVDWILFAENGIEADANVPNVLSGYLQSMNVAAVFPTTLRSTGLIEQAGMEIQPDGGLLHMCSGLPYDCMSYMERALYPADYPVVYPGYFIVRKSDFDAFGGFDEAFVTQAYKAADLSMKLILCGKLIVHTPLAHVIVKSSASLLYDGNDDDRISREELVDRELFRSRYSKLIKCGALQYSANIDPYSPYYKLKDITDITG